MFQLYIFKNWENEIKYYADTFLSYMNIHWVILIFQKRVIK